MFMILLLNALDGEYVKKEPADISDMDKAIYHTL